MTFSELFGNTPELKILELIIPLAELGPLGFFESEPVMYPFTPEMVMRGTGLSMEKVIKSLKKFENLGIIVEQKEQTPVGWDNNRIYRPTKWVGNGHYVFRPESNTLRAVNNIILVEKAKEMKMESFRKMTPPQ